MHIGIAGNIGTGKTTLTRMLCEQYGWTPKYESVMYNPYLDDYYKDIQRWSFALEIYFLKQRIKDIIEIGKSKDVIVQDRTIFEGVYIFAANNRDQGNISERDYQTFMDVFESMMVLIKVPDLMIYLRSSLPRLVGQIQKRGRSYEQSISLEYLKGLNDKYEDFIYNKYPGKVLTVETEGMDFENNPADFEKITNMIDAELFGLFSDNNKTL